MNDVHFVEAHATIAFSFSHAASMEYMLARHQPNILSIEFISELLAALIAFLSSCESFAIVLGKFLVVSDNLIPHEFNCGIQDANEVEFCLNFVFESSSEIIVFHRVPTLLEEADHAAQIDMFRHLAEEMLVPDQYEFFELHFFFVTLAIS